MAQLLLFFAPGSLLNRLAEVLGIEKRRGALTWSFLVRRSLVERADSAPEVATGGFLLLDQTGRAVLENAGCERVATAPGRVEMGQCLKQTSGQFLLYVVSLPIQVARGTDEVTCLLSDQPRREFVEAVVPILSLHWAL